MKKLLTHISTQIQYHRNLQDITKSDLSKSTGIKRRRLSKIELRQCAAKPWEALRLSEVLKFVPGRLEIAKRATRIAWPDIEAPNYSTGDRPFTVRLTDARRQVKSLVEKLEKTVAARSDSGELASFLQDVHADSWLEAIALLRLLAGGFRYAYDSPGRLGYHGNMIVDPFKRENVTHSRRPALFSEFLAVFPQVSFDVGRVIRVDWLICLREHGAPRWVIVEIDGDGHQPDHSRELLKHPVLRFTTSEVLAHTFLSDLRQRLSGTTIGRAA